MPVNTEKTISKYDNAAWAERLWYFIPYYWGACSPIVRIGSPKA
jgi:hypothetical protein